MRCARRSGRRSRAGIRRSSTRTSAPSTAATASFAARRFEADRAPRPRRACRRGPAPAFGYLEAPIGGMILEPGEQHRQGPEHLTRGLRPGAAARQVRPLRPLRHRLPRPLPRLGARARTASGCCGIDYRYCKGCLKCIEACPTGALVERREEAGWADARARCSPFAEVTLSGRCDDESRASAAAQVTAVQDRQRDGGARRPRTSTST